MYDTFSEIAHETDKRCVPFIGNFCESGVTGGHEDLTHSVFEFTHMEIVDPEERMGGNFFGVLVLKFPDTVFSLQSEGLSLLSTVKFVKVVFFHKDN